MFNVCPHIPLIDNKCLRELRDGTSVICSQLLLLEQFPDITSGLPVIRASLISITVRERSVVNTLVLKLWKGRVIWNWSRNPFHCWANPTMFRTILTWWAKTAHARLFQKFCVQFPGLDVLINECENLVEVSCTRNCTSSLLCSCTVIDNCHWKRMSLPVSVILFHGWIRTIQEHHQFSRQLG